MSQPNARKVSYVLQAVARDVDTSFETHLGEPIGWCLFAFSDGNVQYVSSTQDRAEVSRAMRAILDGWDKGMPDVPVHKKQ